MFTRYNFKKNLVRSFGLGVVHLRTGKFLGRWRDQQWGKKCQNYYTMLAWGRYGSKPRRILTKKQNLMTEKNVSVKGSGLKLAFLAGSDMDS